MSIGPSCHIYQTTFLDSFQSSLSRIHGCRLQFLRYGSSIPFKKYNFYITQKILDSKSSYKENPPRKSSFALSNNNGRTSVTGETPVSESFISNGFSGRGWIEKWSDTHHSNVLKRPQALLDYRNGDGGISSEDDDDVSTSLSTGSSTMEKIVEKLKRFGYVDEVKEEKRVRVPERGSVEDIFYVEEGMLPNSRGGFSVDTPLGVENFVGGNEEVRFPWEKTPAKQKVVEGSVQQRSRTSLAELTLPESELRRLRNLAFRIKQKTKIGGAGVTQEIVNAIHEKWKTSEIVRIRCEGPPALNMKRMHEILERKTGGLVIWRSGTAVSLYRGASYELPSFQQQKQRIQNKNEFDHNSYAAVDDRDIRHKMQRGSNGDMQVGNLNRGHSASEVRDAESLPEVKYEHEIDKLLDGLGPRYTDWPGSGPLPVDADLLPGVIPGYKPPFRVLPYGVRSSLGLKEATALRRLARSLPPHFALGRSRQHQGLAMAMIKLWESSSIAKVALKRGVQLTTSERMAEDIKKITGGTIVSRNKDYIVFYRGKDFLSPEVTEALLERERLATSFQDEEEQARLRASSLFSPNFETTEEAGTAGTLGETLEADARWGKKLNDSEKDKMMRAAEIERHASLVRKLERKLALAESKLTKAERALTKVEQFLKPVDRPADPESITDEERFMFRKVGLRMKAFLLLGRRGVFDGTVENMHLHWKYRELVKVMVNAKTFDQVRNVALALEAESGGVLVSVDKTSKGFAVIVFRGRDYHRPSSLRPKNLLTKRKALARSIEMQRREALIKHFSIVQRRVEMLKSELDRMEAVKDQGDEELYSKLDSAYSTEDEDDNEDDGDAGYLETDGIEDVDGDSSNNAIHNLHSESNFPYNGEDETWGSDSEELKANAFEG